MNSKTVYPLVILAVFCGYLAAQSRPAAPQRDGVLRASGLEITNAKGSVVFSVASTDDGDGHLQIYDANGNKRFEISLPRQSVPGDSTKYAGAKVTVFNQADAAVFDFTSGPLGAGGSLQIGGGVKDSTYNAVSISAINETGGQILIYNDRNVHNIQLTTLEGKGTIKVGDMYNNNQVSLTPKEK